jgi:DNA repair protein RadA/Sms
MVEVQALVNKSELAMPRRVAVGFDRNRLAMLVAVLGRHARLPLSQADIFVTIAGGIRIDEPAADLAVALAIASAERNVPLPSRVAAIGEISLTGELRSCSQSERRIAEAGRAGFSRIVVPAADASRAGGIAAGVANVRGVLASLLSEGSSPQPAAGAQHEDRGV